MYKQSPAMEVETSPAGAAWDPATGHSVGEDELAALLTAAGATPAAPAIQPRVDALRIDLIVVRPDTGETAIADTFVTTEIDVASDRMCTFLSRVVDANSSVKIHIGALSAIICLHPSGRAFQAVWMHCGLAYRTQTEPVCIVYSAEQLPGWTHSVCRAFQGMIRNSAALKQLENTALQRRMVAHSKQVPHVWMNRSI